MYTYVYSDVPISNNSSMSICPSLLLFVCLPSGSAPAVPLDGLHPHSAELRLWPLRVV